MKIKREKCKKCGRCTEICLNNANEIIDKETTASEVIEEVIKDKMIHVTSCGGITFTGGEPSYQPDFTLEFLHLARNAGISLAMETCGINQHEFYKKAADPGTTFLYDIKCIDPEQYRRLTGSDNAHIFSNFNYFKGRGTDVIRLSLIPCCNDNDDEPTCRCPLFDSHCTDVRISK